jgi:hypothetical protein
MGGEYSMHGARRCEYRILVREPEGRTPLGRPRRKWEDNIKMDFLRSGMKQQCLINLTLDEARWRAVVNAVMSFRVL